MAARVTWESMRPSLGNIDGTVGDNGRDLPKLVGDLCRFSLSSWRDQSELSLGRGFCEIEPNLAGGTTLTAPA